MAIKLGKLYNGRWPHPDNVGVGLRLEGMPNDPERFITWLMDYGCHPKAGARICERLAAQGFDLLTVMAHLPFEEIADNIKQFSVTLTIVEPQENWQQKYEDGPFPDNFVPPHSRPGHRHRYKKYE